MWRALLVAAAAAATTACAFTDIPLTLPTKGLPETVPGGRGRQVVVVVPFADDRSIQRCGMQKNGYNMDTADAVCQSEPEAWIAQQLADELRASGFTVLAEGSPHRPGALEVEGSLIKVFVEPVLGAWTASLEADLSVELHASTETGLRASRTFFVKGWKGGVAASTMQPFHTALARAAHGIVEEMVRSIIELMDDYPELGAREGTSRSLASLPWGNR